MIVCLNPGPNPGQGLGSLVRTRKFLAESCESSLASSITVSMKATATKIEATDSTQSFEFLFFV